MSPSLLTNALCADSATTTTSNSRYNKMAGRGNYFDSAPTTTTSTSITPPSASAISLGTSSSRLRSLTMADSLEDLNLWDLSTLILKDRSLSCTLSASTPDILSALGRTRGDCDVVVGPTNGRPDKPSKSMTRTLFRYFRKKIAKGRRKDKDSPTPPTPEEQKEYLEDPNTKDRISDADFFKLVALPPSLDLNEWMATHTISLFNHVNLIYGVVSQYCTPDTCPAMTAPDNVQYFWHDDKGKKSKNTACQYIDYCMAHIEQLTNDEAVFPTKYGNPFPADMEAVHKRIHKYLFQVLAHIYHAHYRLLHQLGLHAHLNTLFTHFMVFTSKFDLIQGKDSDILLNLFSLLLKNLADPSQNPQLRQELEGKEAAKKEKQRQYEEENSNSSSSMKGYNNDNDNDDSREEEKMDVSSPPSSNNNNSSNNDNVLSSSSFSSSSSCIAGGGAGGDNSQRRDNNICDSSSNSNNKNNSSSLSSSFERNGNIGGGGVGATVHSQQPLPSSSSKPPLVPPSDNSMRTGSGDGSKPPTDWLGGMQISAT